MNRPSCHRDRCAGLFLDLNSYFASVRAATRSGAARQAGAGRAGEQRHHRRDRRERRGERYGISTGTPVWESEAACAATLIVTPARHEKYVEFHDAILAEIWKHIPVTKVCSIDEVACRLLDNENSPAAA